ncbi:hypothetical protein ABEB36_008540 [Hypothenemus hampei]|uniref:Uncharacterized protein n=1 Tax=Hypothenemus hampei TaxID=57062 RepID=A0ABD1EQ47_HYPHA
MQITTRLPFKKASPYRFPIVYRKKVSSSQTHSSSNVCICFFNQPDGIPIISKHVPWKKHAREGHVAVLPNVAGLQRSHGRNCEREAHRLSLRKLCRSRRADAAAGMRKDPERSDGSRQDRTPSPHRRFHSLKSRMCVRAFGGLPTELIMCIV